MPPATPRPSGYRGRFAPSPTGPLHEGSLTTALASWLDARAHAGTWLVRIEDIDPPRCAPGAGNYILTQLAQAGLHPDAPPTWQSTRHAGYAQALAQLQDDHLAYPCGCTRKDIAAAQALLGHPAVRHTERPYPGTCRNGLPPGLPVRSWRLHLQHCLDRASHESTDAPLLQPDPQHSTRPIHHAGLPSIPQAGEKQAQSTSGSSHLPANTTAPFPARLATINPPPAPGQMPSLLPPPGPTHAAAHWQTDTAFTLHHGCLHWHDRRLGHQQQRPTDTAGDIVLRRADGLWSYQIAVVVDDALQGITHVVRGEDLADSTPRQLLLQQALHLPHPIYLHTPLVRMPDGEKLSKQHGAPAVDLSDPLAALQRAAQFLGLPALPQHLSVPQALQQWTCHWQAMWAIRTARTT